MNELNACSIKKWIVHQTDPFTFEQLQSYFDGDYEVLKDIVFEILQEDKSIISQVFDKDRQYMMFKKAE